MQSFQTIRAYKSLANRISISNTGNTDVAMLDQRRIIVPDRAVAAITQELHRAHSGVEKTYKTASQLYYWPGMKNSIRQTIDNCKVCREDRPKQTRATATKTAPSAAQYPMNQVGTDLFDTIGKKWIVLVHRYSGYAWTSKLKRTDTASVVGQLSDWFTEVGWPTAVRTDGGPQFRTDFALFYDWHGIKHELSSPYNPESNGLVEAAMKNIQVYHNTLQQRGAEYQAGYRSTEEHDVYGRRIPKSAVLRQKTEAAAPHNRRAGKDQGKHNSWQG